LGNFLLLRLAPLLISASMQPAQYMIAAYAITAFLLGALIVRVWWRARSVRKALARQPDAHQP